MLLRTLEKPAMRSSAEEYPGRSDIFMASTSHEDIFFDASISKLCESEATSKTVLSRLDWQAQPPRGVAIRQTRLEGSGSTAQLHLPGFNLTHEGGLECAVPLGRSYTRHKPSRALHRPQVPVMPSSAKLPQLCNGSCVRKPGKVLKTVLNLNLCRVHS